MGSWTPAVRKPAVMIETLVRGQILTKLGPAGARRCGREAGDGGVLKG